MSTYQLPISKLSQILVTFYIYFYTSHQAPSLANNPTTESPDCNIWRGSTLYLHLPPTIFRQQPFHPHPPPSISATRDVTHGHQLIYFGQCTEDTFKMFYNLTQMGNCGQFSMQIIQTCLISNVISLQRTLDAFQKKTSTVTATFCKK